MAKESAALPKRPRTAHRTAHRTSSISSAKGSPRHTDHFLAYLSWGRKPPNIVHASDLVAILKRPAASGLPFLQRHGHQPLQAPHGPPGRVNPNHGAKLGTVRCTSGCWVLHSKPTPQASTLRLHAVSPPNDTRGSQHQGLRHRASTQSPHPLPQRHAHNSFHLLGCNLLAISWTLHPNGPTPAKALLSPTG